MQSITLIVSVPILQTSSDTHIRLQSHVHSLALCELPENGARSFDWRQQHTQRFTSYAFTPVLISLQFSAYKHVSPFAFTDLPPRLPVCPFLARDSIARLTFILTRSVTYYFIDTAKS